MNNISPFVDGLIEAFQCLPGVGPKSARRMVLHLLEKDREAGKVLAESLELTLSNVGLLQVVKQVSIAMRKVGL